MRIGSLFSGYMGLDIATEAVFGATTAWVADNAPGPVKILAHRAPGIPNLGDITTIDWSTVEPVDIITGGSPCQDVSHAGKRAGMTAGTRSNLWVTMRDAIATIKPTFVVWENVRGAYSAEADSDLEYWPGMYGRYRGPRACSASTRTCTRRPFRPRVSHCMARRSSCRYRGLSWAVPGVRPRLATRLCYCRPSPHRSTRVRATHPTGRRTYAR